MPSVITSLCTSLLVLSSGAASWPHRPQRPCEPRDTGVGKALYFMTNDAANAVAAIPISADGKLSAGSVTQTGGMGSNAVDSATNQSSRPDALLSQSSVAVAGNSIFAVNAGSNTVSMLSIAEGDPTQLKLVGSPAAVPGDFPNTVAASTRHGLVCVGVTGARAGVSCARFDEKTGMGAMDGLRPFALGQSTPPTGPANTVSQVFFSEDENALLVTVKGDPASNNTGFFAAFPVEAARSFRGETTTLCREAIVSSPPGTALLFGSQPIPGTSNIFTTDPSFGAGVLSVDARSGQATLAAAQPLAGQAATCWTAISPASGTAFVTDVGVPRIVEMRLDNAGIVSETDLSRTGVPGLIDIKATGDMLYALAPGNGSAEALVLVLDTSTRGGPELVQSFGLRDLGAGANSQGMAVLQ